MLLSVGGNPAVQFWQRLLEGVDGEMDAVKSYAEEDDDEVNLGLVESCRDKIVAQARTPLCTIQV